MTIREHSDLSTLTRLKAAFAGDLQLETRASGCFREESDAIHLAWSEHDARVDVRRVELSVSVPLAQPTARAWIHEVCEALLKPEQELGGRSTTEHSGTLTWKARDAEGQFAGSLTWHTRDADPEMVALVHHRRPHLADVARKSHVAAFSMEELAARMRNIADAISGRRGWIDQAATFLPYFAEHAKRQPLFVPEFNAAERILALMRKETRTAADAEQIRRELRAVDQEPHYDGSGWHGFRNAVRWWLEEGGAAP